MAIIPLLIKYSQGVLGYFDVRVTLLSGFIKYFICTRLKASNFNDDMPLTVFAEGLNVSVTVWVIDDDFFKVYCLWGLLAKIIFFLLWTEINNKNLLSSIY